MKYLKKLQAWDSKRRRRISAELSDLKDRRRVDHFIRWMDHGIFREMWSNHFEIAPGVFRSNHPPTSRFAKLHANGLQSIITLRGSDPHVANNLEKQICGELGLVLKSADLDAIRAPKRKVVQQLIGYFREVPKPLLIHCKSGADRAGLASAIYLMVIENQPVHEAKKMLSPKFLHFRRTHTGVLDHVLDTFELRQARGAIGFEDWINDEYSADEIQSAFNAKRK